MASGESVPLSRWAVPIASGEVPVVSDVRANSTVVILAHGAGSHMEHRTMEWLASLVRDAGVSVVRFNFLYRVQGKSMPDRMPVAIGTYRQVIESVREKLQPEKLIIGGHSFGGRVASMLEAEGKTADGLLLFGYPLHPPGQPEKLRAEHLLRIQTVTYQLNGTEDLLCTKSIMDPIAQSLDPKIWHLHWIDGADHSYSVKKSSGRSKRDVAEEITRVVEEMIDTLHY